MRFCTPPKFKILVANTEGSSDPGRNSGGNPVKIRTGFTLQQVNLPNGKAQVGGPVQSPPAVSSSNYSAAIKVLSADYWDPTIAPPGPFYYQEEVRVFDQYPTAGSEFGVGNGSGTGTASDIALSLATWVNRSVDQVSAISAGDTVYLTSSRPDAMIPIQATNDMSTLLGALVFQVRGPGGVVLSGSGHERASFYIFKPSKTQSAPGILR